MNKGGILIIFAVCLAVIAQFAYAQPAPPRDPTPDEIARIMEAERRAQEQAQQASGFTIQMAQEIAAAIKLINLKAEELRLVVGVELNRALTAESHELALGHYETCLMHGFAFRRFAEGQLANKLDDVNHPRRLAAVPPAPARPGAGGRGPPARGSADLER